jgi:hypothetical protein
MTPTAINPLRISLLPPWLSERLPVLVFLLLRCLIVAFWVGISAESGLISYKQILSYARANFNERYLPLQNSSFSSRKVIF